MGKTIDKEFADPRVSQESLVSFYKAIREAERIVISRQPDLLIGPLRGAEPIIKSIGIIASLECHKLPTVLYIGTGCIDSLFEGQQRLNPKPLSDEQKLDLVKESLSPYVIQRNEKFRLCLIDEVNGGGSIVKNYDYINGALRIFYPKTDFNLEAIAICNPQEKCGRFKQLMRMRKITPLYVADLFTVDRTRYLTPLVRKGHNVEQKGKYPKDLKSELYNELARLHTVSIYEAQKP